MHELISLLANGLIVGFITFQVVINTAIIFTKLDAENASVVLRAIFPKFFLTIFAFSAISFMSLYLSSNKGLLLNLSAMTIILAGACFFIIPATNDARDRGNAEDLHGCGRVKVLTVFVIYRCSVALKSKVIDEPSPSSLFPFLSLCNAFSSWNLIRICFLVTSFCVGLVFCLITFF